MSKLVFRVLVLILVSSLSACGGGGGSSTPTTTPTTTTTANTPPVIAQGTSTNVTMSVNSTPTAFNLTLGASDANGDTLTWSISTNAKNGTASVPAPPNNTGTNMAVTYTPNTNYVGSDRFDVTVDDGHGGLSTITVNVAVNNDAPVITQGASTSVNMFKNGSPVSVTLDATDANNDPLNWSLDTTSVTAQNGTPSVTGTNVTSPTVTYTPNTDYVGTDSFVVQVTDSHGATDTITVNVTVTVNNTVTINVDGGPLAPGSTTYNRPFVSVTICDATATNCQTIDHIVLDTGAVGLRVMSSVLTPTMLAALPTYKDTFSTVNAGGPTNKDIGTCYPLATGYLWGTLRTAMVRIGGEQTTSPIPIQMIGDLTAGQVPSGTTNCTSTGTASNNLSSQSALLANGILGVKYFKPDCSTTCTSASNNVYYVCSNPADGSTCAPIDVPVVDQVPNPAFLFGNNGSGPGISDNNGLTIHLPIVVDYKGALNVTGTLTFGINTQPNNQLGSATVLPVTSKGFVSTIFGSTNLCNSIIDSGTNNYNFAPDASIPTPPLCTGSNAGFYCPTSGGPASFTATIHGMNGSTASIMTDFYVANLGDLNGADTAFYDTAYSVPPDFSSVPITNCPGSNPTSGTFVWGLPFFFGKDVTFAFQNQTFDTTNPGAFVTFKAN